MRREGLLCGAGEHLVAQLTGKAHSMRCGVCPVDPAEVELRKDGCLTLRAREEAYCQMKEEERPLKAADAVLSRILNVELHFDKVVISSS